MMGVEQAISQGYAAFQRKDFAVARQALSGVNHPQAIHLLGLVEKGAGNYPRASELLAHAAALDPTNPEIPNNQGLLARLTGELQVAETAFRKALQLKPDFQSACLSLGRTLSGLDRHEEAMATLETLIGGPTENVAARVTYANAALEMKLFDVAKAHIDASLRVSPQHAGARHAQGVWALSTGEREKAEGIFTALLAENPEQAEANYMMARVALEKGDMARAQGFAEKAFAAKPAEAYFLLLADTYWMGADIDKFERLIEGALNMPALALIAVGLLQTAQRTEDALEALESLPEGWKILPGAQTQRSALLMDMGDVEGALIAGRAARQNAGHGVYDHNFAAALLASGAGEEALAFIKEAREANPLSQLWLAYEASALRLLGDASYDQLIDYERHVRVYELPVPDGFDTLADFNAAFLTLLDEINPFEQYPLKRSLRGGIQTPQDLCTNPDPLLQSYFKALDTPIRDYMAQLGTQADHPSAMRNSGDYRFHIGWSVRLGSGGHHVNHIHPKGWISSAYYVSVPDEVASGEDKAGWIKFGEPPFRTEPVLPAEHWIQPKAGMLVLFPSFLWHGTEPIHDGSVRVTAPFDVVPA